MKSNAVLLSITIAQHEIIMFHDDSRCYWSFSGSSHDVDGNTIGERGPNVLHFAQ